MEYKSSLTNPIKVVIIIIFLFWIANIFAIITTGGISDAIISSVLLLVFASTYVTALVKGIYIVVDNNSVKYVHMFLLKKAVEIGKINKIQMGYFRGYSSLLLLYEKEEETEKIKITTFSFKKETLRQFVSDLTKQNPKISVNQSVYSLIN